MMDKGLFLLLLIFADLNSAERALPDVLKPVPTPIPRPSTTDILPTRVSFAPLSEGYDKVCVTSWLPPHRGHGGMPAPGTTGFPVSYYLRETSEVLYMQHIDSKAVISELPVFRVAAIATKTWAANVIPTKNEISAFTTTYPDKPFTLYMTTTATLVMIKADAGGIYVGQEIISTVNSWQGTVDNTAAGVRACYTAPAGKYCPRGVVTTACNPCDCAAGMVCPLGSSTPTAECAICPMGYYCGGAATIPIACAQGYFCPSKSHEPLECSCPKYTECSEIQAVSQNCVPCGTKLCPGGKALGVAPASGVKTCLLFGDPPLPVTATSPQFTDYTNGMLTSVSETGGFYTDLISRACLYPPLGTYCLKRDDGAIRYLSECTAYSCSPGSTPVLGATAPVCLLCPPGNYCPDGKEKKSCPAGSCCVKPGNTAPIPCKCTVGRYCPSECATLQDKAQCAPCPSGRTCAGGSAIPVITTVLKCPPNKCVKDGVCVVQPLGNYIDSERKCVAGPVGRYCPVGAQTLNSCPPCSCTRGTYCPENTVYTNGCVPCVEGSYCKGGAFGPLRCSVGAGKWCPTGWWTVGGVNSVDPVLTRKPLLDTLETKYRPLVNRIWYYQMLPQAALDFSIAPYGGYVVSAFKEELKQFPIKVLPEWEYIPIDLKPQGDTSGMITTVLTLLRAVQPTTPAATKELLFTSIENDINSGITTPQVYLPRWSFQCDASRLPGLLRRYIRGVRTPDLYACFVINATQPTLIADIMDRIEILSLASLSATETTRFQGIVNGYYHGMLRNVASFVTNTLQYLPLKESVVNSTVEREKWRKSLTPKCPERTGPARLWAMQLDTCASANTAAWWGKAERTLSKPDIRSFDFLTSVAGFMENPLDTNYGSGFEKTRGFEPVDLRDQMTQLTQTQIPMVVSSLRTLMLQKIEDAKQATIPELSLYFE